MVSVLLYLDVRVSIPVPDSRTPSLGLNMGDPKHNPPIYHDPCKPPFGNPKPENEDPAASPETWKNMAPNSKGAPKRGPESMETLKP